MDCFNGKTVREISRILSEDFIKIGERSSTVTIRLVNYDKQVLDSLASEMEKYLSSKGLEISVETAECREPAYVIDVGYFFS